MANDELDHAQKEHAEYLEERKQLIDAARESSRTFDKAVLTFGSAVLGFSIAFLKDIAPTPAPETLRWLGASWLLFCLGLLVVLLSFLFSHRACLFDIEVATREMTIRGYPAKHNRWGIITDVCNFLCVFLLFTGLLCWSRFAFDNLSQGGSTSMNKLLTPTEKKGYVPPAPPAKAPQAPPTPPPAAPKK
jgi:hypothetical protein